MNSYKLFVILNTYYIFIVKRANIGNSMFVFYSLKYDFICMKMMMIMIRLILKTFSIRVPWRGNLKSFFINGEVLEFHWSDPQKRRSLIFSEKGFLKSNNISTIFLGNFQQKKISQKLIQKIYHEKKKSGKLCSKTFQIFVLLQGSSKRWFVFSFWKAR